MKTTKARTTANILALLIAIMAIGEILLANTQVFVTEVRLMTYNICTQDYIDSGFTGASDETMEQMFLERQKLYNSDNPIVWVAANAPSAIKVLLFLLSLAIYGATILLIIASVSSGIKKIQKETKKRRIRHIRHNYS